MSILDLIVAEVPKTAILLFWVIVIPLFTPESITPIIGIEKIELSLKITRLNKKFII